MVFMYFLQIARIQSIFNHPFKDWEKIQTQGYNGKSKGFENKSTGLILLCNYYITNYLSCSSDLTTNFKHPKVSSASICYLEANAACFRLLMKGKFDVYSLWPFGKNLFPNSKDMLIMIYQFSLKHFFTNLTSLFFDYLLLFDW